MQILADCGQTDGHVAWCSGVDYQTNPALVARRKFILSACISPAWQYSYSIPQINRTIGIIYYSGEGRYALNLWSKRLIVLSKGSVSYRAAYTAVDGI